jgi:hypothetical protein
MATSSTSVAMPLLTQQQTNHNRMFHYKSTRTERQSKHKFRDASMEPALTRVNKTKPIAAGNVIHRFSLPSHLN